MIKFFTYNFKVTFIKLIFFACELYLFQEIPLNAIILFSGIDIFSLILNFLPTDLLLNSIMPVLLMQQDQLNMYLLIFYLLKSLLISLSYLKIIQKTTIKLAGSEEDIANHKTDNFHNYKYITLNNASIEDKFINEQTKDKFIFETMNNSYKNMISFLLNQTKTLNFSKIEINNNLSNLIITNDIHILTQINEYMSNWAVITNDEICIKYAQILNKTINSYNTNYNNIFDFYNFNLQIITEDMKEYGSLISKIFMYNKYINIMWDDFTLKKSKINILKQNGLNKKMSIEQNSDKKIIHINLKNILDLDIKSFFNESVKLRFLNTPLLRRTRERRCGERFLLKITGAF